MFNNQFSGHHLWQMIKYDIYLYVYNRSNNNRNNKSNNSNKCYLNTITQQMKCIAWINIDFVCFLFFFSSSSIFHQFQYNMFIIISYLLNGVLLCSQCTLMNCLWCLSCVRLSCAIIWKINTQFYMKQTILLLY